MEFDGQYLTYAEYTLLGGTLDETSFDLLEFESRKQIDLRTKNRLKGIEEIPQEVKMCDFHLIEKIRSYAETVDSPRNIASENTDGYSVSYVDGTRMKEIISSKNSELQDVMITDLYGVAVNGEHIIFVG